MADVTLNWVITDCIDNERVAAFWSQLLGVDIEGRRGPYIWLSKSEHVPIKMCFQRVTETRGGKNRVHVDLTAIGDHATIIARVVALGGRVADGYESGGFPVMQDPEGNEFCVLAEKFELSAEGLYTVPET